MLKILFLGISIIIISEIIRFIHKPHERYINTSLISLLSGASNLNMFSSNIPAVFTPSNETIIPVVAYTENNFKGQAIPIDTVNIFSYSAIGIKDFAAASFKIQPGYTLILYQDPNFQGTNYVLNTNTSNLNNINLATIGSIKVLKNGLTIYPNCYNWGVQTVLDSGSYDLKQLLKLGVEQNSVNAVQLSPGYKTILTFSDGSRQTISDDLDCISTTGTRLINNIEVLYSKPVSTTSSYSSVYSSVPSQYTKYPVVLTDPLSATQNTKTPTIYPSPKPYVQFFTAQNYDGNMYEFSSDVPELHKLGANIDNTFSSCKIGPYTQIWMFNNIKYEGWAWAIINNKNTEATVSFLDPSVIGWNDNISSIKVGVINSKNKVRGIQLPYAKIFNSVNFRGKSMLVTSDVETLSADFNDKVSSLRVGPYTDAVFYFDFKFQGPSIVITNLNDFEYELANLVDMNYHGQISSISLNKIG